MELLFLLLLLRTAVAECGCCGELRWRWPSVSDVGTCVCSGSPGGAAAPCQGREAGRRQLM